jgi:hypothetical protein
MWLEALIACWWLPCCEGARINTPVDMFGVLAICGAQVERGALSRIVIDNIMPHAIYCLRVCAFRHASIVLYIQYNDDCILHEHSFLDTVSGVASSVFVAEAEEVSPTSPPLHIHHREWFASEADDVLVGTMRCLRVGRMKDEEEEEEEDGGGCLNVHLRLGREVRNTQGGPPGATTPLSEGAWWAGPWRLRRQSHVAIIS